MTGAVATRRWPGGMNRSAGSRGGTVTPAPIASCLSSCPITARLSVVAQHLGDVEGHLEGLLVVQARIHQRLVPAGQSLLVHVLTSTEHLGDIVTGELDVQSTRDRADAVVHLEESVHLVDHGAELTGLVPGRRRDG